MSALRILLVEDESLVRDMAAEALRDRGFDILEAETGDEAAELLVDPDGVDVLFTDVQMPGALDGVALAARARELYPEIPIIIASGYAPQLGERLSGFDPKLVFLRKPYRLTEVADMAFSLGSTA